MAKSIAKFQKKPEKKPETFLRKTGQVFGNVLAAPVRLTVKATRQLRKNLRGKSGSRIVKGNTTVKGTGRKF